MRSDGNAARATDFPQISQIWALIKNSIFFLILSNLLIFLANYRKNSNFRKQIIHRKKFWITTFWKILCKFLVQFMKHNMYEVCNKSLPHVLTRQGPYRGLTDRIIFFLSGFWLGPPVATPRSHRPGFFHFFKSRFRPRHQWPYHGLSDRVFSSKIF